MSSSQLASSFAPYAPPPDDRAHRQPSTSQPSRSWLPNHAPLHTVNTSYQSGGIPTLGTSASGGGNADLDAHANIWETSAGLSADILAAAAYLLGPVSAFALLILETQSDYVRFHAYQSALLTGPLTLLWIFASLVGLPSWMRILLFLILLFCALSMALQAYRDVSQGRGINAWVPYISPIAERWVAEE